MNLFKIFTLFGFLMNSIQSISVNSIIMNKYKEFIQENNKDFSYSHFLTFKNNIEYIDSFHDDLYELEMNKFTDVNMLKNQISSLEAENFQNKEILKKHQKFIDIEHNEDLEAQNQYEKINNADASNFKRARSPRNLHIL